MSGAKAVVVNVDIRAHGGLCLCLNVVKLGGKLTALRLGREPATNLPLDSRSDRVSRGLKLTDNKGYGGVAQVVRAWDS